MADTLPTALDYGRLSTAEPREGLVRRKKVLQAVIVGHN